MGKEKKHGLLGKILIFSTQTPDFIWRKRTEKQKFDMEQNSGFRFLVHQIRISIGG